MAKANKYKKDSKVTLDDSLLGNDFENRGATKTYSVKSLVDLINESNSNVKNIQYSFSSEEDATLPTGNGIFNTNGNNTSFASITEITINKLDYSNNDLSNFFSILKDNLGKLVLKLFRPGSIDHFAFLKVTEATENTNSYVLSVEAIGTVFSGTILDGMTFNLDFYVGGSDASQFSTESFTFSGNNTFQLNKIPGFIFSIYVNTKPLIASQYTLTGNEITIDGLYSGDVITLKYL